MASSKVIGSLSSRSSDLSQKSSSGSSKPKPQPTSTNSLMTVEDFLLRQASTSGDSALIDAFSSKTVDDVWREIVSGERKDFKEEASDGIMTLEDFLLAKTGGDDEDEDEDKDDDDLKREIFRFESSLGNGVEVMSLGKKGKRGRGVIEQLDKAAQQRQRRMIKNRESAARSRERKQAYQVELESLAVKLEEENEQLLREKAERRKERLKQLMETVIPVEEKNRRAALPILRRVRSFQW